MSERTIQRVGAKVVVRAIDNAGRTLHALTATSRLRLQGPALAAAFARPDVQSALTDVNWRTGAGHVSGVSVVYGGRTLLTPPNARADLQAASIISQRIAGFPGPQARFPLSKGLVDAG
ncbi:MAG: hypothetical protein OXQ29_23890 [Rhodospirillaceae bacterium]|nr:hypothetical protein [Rhodospirillaceae bacterium]